MRIVVALDGSESGEKAFEHGIEIAKNQFKCNVELHIISVIAPAATPQKLAPWETLLSGYCSRVSSDPPSSPSSFTVTSLSNVIQHADPREAILSYCLENQSDLLVVGTRGLGSIGRLFLGSVSQYCVEHAPCDVVVAK